MKNNNKILWGTLFLVSLTTTLVGCHPYPNPYQNNQQPLPQTQQPTTPVIIQNPTTPPTPAVTPVVTYGPGSGNNMNTNPQGYLTIHTNSANGALSLRSAPNQSASPYTEIPNGTSGIYYFDRIQIGNYVWYNATYGNYNGWLRGDYVDVY